MTASALDDIPGVGPTRKKALLAHFGSLKRIRSASEEEIAAVSGITADLAADILRFVSPLPEVEGDTGGHETTGSG